MSNVSSKTAHLLPPAKWGVTGVVASLVLLYGVQFLLETAAYLLLGKRLYTSTEVQLVLRGFTYGTVLLLLWHLLRYYKSSLGAIGFTSFKPRYAGIALLALPLYLLFSAGATRLFSELFPRVDLEKAQQLGIGEVGGPLALGLAFLALVVLAPLVEEAIFRGMIFRALLRRFKPVTAAIVTSALFGLGHMQWNVGIDTFALSLVLCFLAYKSQSIWPAVLLHATKNFIAFLLVFVIHPRF